MSEITAAHIKAVLAILPADEKLAGKILQIEFDDGFPHETDSVEYLVVTDSGHKLAQELVETGTRSPMSTWVRYRAFGQETTKLHFKERNNDGYCATIEVDFFVPDVKVL